MVLTLYVLYWVLTIDVLYWVLTIYVLYWVLTIDVLYWVITTAFIDLYSELTTNKTDIDQQTQTNFTFKSSSAIRNTSIDFAKVNIAGISENHVDIVSAK